MNLLKAHNLNPFHPKVPVELETVTNYKEMPKEYLSRAIPEGRKMIKWAPFATMPQQFEDIRKQIEYQTKEFMPDVSQEQIDDINNKLNHYSNKPSACFIYSYEDEKVHLLQTVINILDEYNMRANVFLVVQQEFKDLEFNKIIEII
ncbi:YolD-like family protein [Macrococcoides caseolyticum]